MVLYGYARVYNLTPLLPLAHLNLKGRMINGWIISIVFFLLCQPVVAAVEPVKVSLQLRWQHQFQFAGYYAALHKGFYRAAGLDVTLREGGPNVSAMDEVLQGRADFGVSTSGLVNSYLNDKSVLMLAPIIQHSPLVLLSRGKTLTNPADIAKAGAISLQPGDESLDLKAMFVAEGIAFNKLEITTASHGLDDLLAGKIVAMNAYLSNEPFLLEQQGIDYSILKPEHYGMDFYSDVLFTSQRIGKTQPETVAAFRAASLQGWAYALAHTDEIIGLILARYNTQGKSREHLLYEAKIITALISPELIEIGHSNPGRWRHIAEVYAGMGMLPLDASLENGSLQGFLYNPKQTLDLTWFYQILAATLVVIAVIMAIALYIYRINRRLTNSLSELHQAQMELSNREKLYRLLIESMRDVVWIMDPVSLRLRYISPSVLQLRGYTAEEVMARPVEDVGLLEYASISTDKMPEHVYRQEVPLSCKDGTIVWTEVQAKYYLNAETGQFEIQGVTRDITERKQAEDKIKYLAFYDTLTGLANRRRLDECLLHALAVSRRSGRYGAVIFIDLDNFKPINDTHGHAAGDLLLVEVASRLVRSVRNVDVVARFGGDEFVIILSWLDEDQVVSRVKAAVVTEKIRLLLAEPYVLALPHQEKSAAIIEHYCTASIGVALFNGLEAHPQDIIEWADAAMYQAKAEGRNLIRFYEGG
jgi:diguanylate cyclase (GGDEF)-like protein/PAS domain S-box-containing protein